MANCMDTKTDTLEGVKVTPERGKLVLQKIRKNQGFRGSGASIGSGRDLLNEKGPSWDFVSEKDRLKLP